MVRYVSKPNGCDITRRPLLTVPILKADWQESPHLLPSTRALAANINGGSLCGTFEDRLNVVYEGGT